jgi:hypothetical protein
MNRADNYPNTTEFQIELFPSVAEAQPERVIEFPSALDPDFYPSVADATTVPTKAQLAAMDHIVDTGVDNYYGARERVMGIGSAAVSNESRTFTDRPATQTHAQPKSFSPRRNRGRTWRELAAADEAPPHIRFNPYR